MSFQKYSAYKESGVEWIGEIPVWWVTTPIRALAVSAPKSFTDGDWIESPFITDAGVRLLQTGNIGVGNYKEQGFRYISEETFENLHCTEVRPGDLLICRLAEPVGRACIAPALKEKMITSVDVAILKTSLYVSANYFNYVLSAPSYLSFMESECRGGTRNRVSRSFLGSVRVPFPPLPEQQAIASFLDRECGKIDVLIAEQERLIALLAEKRQAVISHAVTKGLNPNAPMKHSGIPWIGMVPEGWEVVATTHRYEVQLGRMLNEERASGSHMRPYLRVFDVQWGRINITDLPLMDFPPETQERYRLKAGDLLVNEGGSYVGRSAIWRGTLEECYYQKSLHRLRSRNAETDTVEFFYYVMEIATRRNVFVAGANQTTIDHLTAEQLRSHRFVFPPFEQQVAIVDYLKEKVSQFDTLTNSAVYAVTLLKERRAALISAAVTGKIDVRAQSKALAA